LFQADPAIIQSPFLVGATLLARRQPRNDRFESQSFLAPEVAMTMPTEASSAHYGHHSGGDGIELFMMARCLRRKVNR
jgi:hypothetical protein